MSRGGLPSVLEILDEGAVIEMPAAPKGADRVITGRASLTRLVGHVTSTWKKIRLMQLTTSEISGSPNRILGEYSVEGVDLDDRLSRNTYLAVARIEHGRIASFRESFDPVPLVHRAGRQTQTPRDSAPIP